MMRSSFAPILSRELAKWSGCMDDAYLARKESSFNVPPYLSVTRAGDREVVHIGCTPIANHFVSDVTSRRQVMVQLAEAGVVYHFNP